MKYVVTLFCVFILSSQLNAGIFSITSTVTSTVNTPNTSTTQTNSTQIVIPTNVTAQILHLHQYSTMYAAPGTSGGAGGGNGCLIIQVNNLNFWYTEVGISQINNQPFVVGPATITLIASAISSTGGSAGSPYNWTAQDNMICTIETNLPTQCISNQFTPNTGVVIPADSSGPVNIILESSVDLINWIPSDPGTYGTTTTNRFFRVRATR